MITARTKKQLVAFVLLTAFGCSWVGYHYAKLDRFFHDTAFHVNAHFATSGGIFTGAEVSYRGVRIGSVSDMKLSQGGVDVILAVDNGWKKIPANTMAIVANKSAVGEQYVELEPKVDTGPYLKDGSQIQTSDTRTPIATTEILQNADNLVQSLPQDSLKTAVTSLGEGFAGTGPSLGQLITDGGAFLKAAQDNFQTTTALINDSKTVLQTQLDKVNAIRGFSQDLALFTDVLAGKDGELRQLVEDGAATSVELRTFLEQNQVDLGRLISNLLTTAQPSYQYLPRIRQVLVIFPTVVSGGFTVLAKQPDGNYNARFGMVLQQNPPVCTTGYNTAPRSPSDLSYQPMDTTSKCSAPASTTNARGTQNAPRVAPDYRAPVAAFDGKNVIWADQGTTVLADPFGGSYVDDLSGKDGLSWLLLQPATPVQ